MRLAGLPCLLAALCAMGSGACRAEPDDSSSVATVYNKATGRLEQLLLDRDGDGRAEARAFMDGPALKHIELDRNGDGRTDRWEYYRAEVPARGERAAAPVIERAEEANGPNERITRREQYADGLLVRVEDDTDHDGRTDKWEYYQAGVLVRVELDLHGKGQPTQRLTYGPDGVVVTVESAPDGDGRFVPVSLPKGVRQSW